MATWGLEFHIKQAQKQQHKSSHCRCLQRGRVLVSNEHTAALQTTFASVFTSVSAEHKTNACKDKKWL
ncbi:hypothetical protein EYF80_049308 [Liparis tanakae]|uniref:Uncharacterized protein n=1 Tax=Liparis tanakae TaxID=230148 RepID=A0A4Z2FH62_9TELE|nr:hypothetical protein EYF80_049308 [Liparis tanakae]